MPTQTERDPKMGNDAGQAPQPERKRSIRPWMVAAAVLAVFVIIVVLCSGPITEFFITPVFSSGREQTQESSVTANPSRKPKTVLEKIREIKLGPFLAEIDLSARLMELLGDPEAHRLRVPYHRRKRFLLLNREDGIKLGNAVCAQLEKQNFCFSDPEMEARVRRIIGKILAVMEEKPDGRFFLLDTDEYQAMCLPNGRICLTRGLLKAHPDDSELAFIIGHEYGHFLAMHQQEDCTKSLINHCIRKSMQFFIKKTDRRKLVDNLYQLASTLGVLLPYNRRMETEADHLGLLLMKRAGYDPAGAVRAMEFIASQDSGDQMFSDHPDGKKRAQDLTVQRDYLNGLAPDAAPYWETKMDQWIEKLELKTKEKLIKLREKLAGLKVPPAANPQPVSVPEKPVGKNEPSSPSAKSGAAEKGK